MHQMKCSRDHLLMRWDWMRELLQLRNAERTIELVRFEHNGSVDYKMQDCDEETYPFGEVFDLVVPGSDDSEGIPAFELLDAVVVNEYVELSSALEQAENGVIGSDYILDLVRNAVFYRWSKCIRC